MNPRLEAGLSEGRPDRLFIGAAHAEPERRPRLQRGRGTRAGAPWAWRRPAAPAARSLSQAGKSIHGSALTARPPIQRFSPSARPVQFGASPTGTRLSGRSLRALGPDPGDGVDFRGIEQPGQQQLLLDPAEVKRLDPAPPSAAVRPGCGRSRLAQTAVVLPRSRSARAIDGASHLCSRTTRCKTAGAIAAVSSARRCVQQARRSATAGPPCDGLSRSRRLRSLPILASALSVHDHQSGAWPHRVQAMGMPGSPRPAPARLAMRTIAVTAPAGGRGGVFAREVDSASDLMHVLPLGQLAAGPGDPASRAALGGWAGNQAVAARADQVGPAGRRAAPPAPRSSSPA